MALLRLLGVTLLAAQVLGKVTHQHGHLDHHQEGYRHAYHNHHHSHLNHHSQDYGHHGYHNDGHEHHAHVHGGHGHGHAHGYSAVLAAEPVITKAVSAGPVVFSKGLAHAPAAVSVHSHTPAYTVAAAPLAAVGHVPAYSVAPALSHEHVALLATAGKPKVYQKSVPAAAIRNIETVMVTKTITPVVTKTTTYLTKAEPALSLGHVQGYKQGAVGHVKVAPVQFNTAYTSFANPTVGINGPVVYKGPAVGLAAVAAAGPVAIGGPEPVGKAAYAAPALQAYAHHGRGHLHGHHAHAAYAVVPGSALAYENYGVDAHAIPVTNFLELKQGSPVRTHGHAAYAAYAH